MYQNNLANASQCEGRQKPKDSIAAVAITKPWLCCVIWSNLFRNMLQWQMSKLRSWAISSKSFVLSFGVTMNIDIGFNSTSTAQHHCDSLSVNERQCGHWQQWLPAYWRYTCYMPNHNCILGNDSGHCRTGSGRVPTAVHKYLTSQNSVELIDRNHSAANLLLILTHLEVIAWPCGECICQAMIYRREKSYVR